MIFVLCSYANFIPKNGILSKKIHTATATATKLNATHSLKTNNIRHEIAHRKRVI